MFENLTELIKWSASHLITWAVLNCLIVGGWWFYEQYQNWVGIPIDISVLTPESKEALAMALVEDGYNVPRPEGKPTKQAHK